MSTMIDCPCGHTFANEDWWGCPKCGEPTTDAKANGAVKKPRRPRRTKDDGTLRSLLP